MSFFLNKIRASKPRWLILPVLFILSYILLLKLADYSFVQIDISNSHSSSFKIYWATDQNPNFTEKRSTSTYVNNRKNHYIIPIPVSLSEIKKLRFDPVKRKAVRTEIREISVHHINLSPVRFKDKSSFSSLKPSKDVTKLSIGNDRLVSTSGGYDPFFLANLAGVERQPEPYVRILQATLLSLMLFFLITQISVVSRHLRFVPLGMVIAASVILALATVTKMDEHPDEITHVQNATFYVNHYIPPEICSEEVLFTYSVYGVSRVDAREIAYFLGGRYLQAVDFIPVPDYLKLRYLNVLLFFVLTFLALRRQSFRMLALPVLLTPQAWYLFSYYNSDALSLFVVLVTGYQIFARDSILRRLLRGESSMMMPVWVCALALLVAMQYWIKINYFFYPLFLGMLAVSWLLVNRRLPRIANPTPILLAIALGTGLFLGWQTTRNVVNDFSISEKMLECRETTAGKYYKPSTPLNETHPYFRLRDKGVTFFAMLEKYNWTERFFYTGLGAYGYTEYLNSIMHYQIASFFILLMFIYVVLTIFILGDAVARLSVLSALAAMFGLVLAAAYNNWTMDLQPQGRYLMVFLPIFGSLMAMYARMLNVRVLMLLAVVPFTLALYSFLAVALVELPKI